ncbi:MAG: carboxymuconolactone decarboxylase family protein [Hyphomicrobiales bacterium]
MSDFNKIFENMLAQSQKMARELNPALENFRVEGFEKLMPTMPRDFMDMIWGNAFNPDGLDAKTRLLVVLAGLTVLGAPDAKSFKATVRHALEADASEKEIAEVIYQMSMLGGLPAMTKALELAQSVFAQSEEKSK